VNQVAHKGLAGRVLPNARLEPGIGARQPIVLAEMFGP
jgi:hypothetical protein